MKKIVITVLFLFTIFPPLVRGQNGFQTNAYAQLANNDTAKYAYKNYITDSWVGKSEQYFGILDCMSEIIDSINVKNKTDWLVESKGSSFVVLEQIRKEISGQFICLERTDGEIIFYAEGFFRPNFSFNPLKLIGWAAKNIVDALRKGEITGKAFFLINYYQDGNQIHNEIKFYLTTDNVIANLWVKGQAEKKANEILRSVVQTFKMVGNK